MLKKGSRQSNKKGIEERLYDPFVAEHGNIGIQINLIRKKQHLSAVNIICGRNRSYDNIPERIQHKQSNQSQQDSINNRESTYFPFLPHYHIPPSSDILLDAQLAPSTMTNPINDLNSPIAVPSE